MIIWKRMLVRSDKHQIVQRVHTGHAHRLDIVRDPHAHGKVPSQTYSHRLELEKSTYTRNCARSLASLAQLDAHSIVQPTTDRSVHSVLSAQMLSPRELDHRRAVCIRHRSQQNDLRWAQLANSFCTHQKSKTNRQRSTHWSSLSSQGILEEFRLANQKYPYSIKLKLFLCTMWLPFKSRCWHAQLLLKRTWAKNAWSNLSRSICFQPRIF